MKEILKPLHLFLVGNQTKDDSYWSLRLWLMRGLGFIYSVAFLILFFQAQGLWGSHGLMPLSRLVTAIHDHFGSSWSAFWSWPSLFYISTSDSTLTLFSVVGLIGAGLLLWGYANFFLLFILWLLQLSFVNSTLIFYSFGWETQLLEFTFLCFFLVPFWDWRLKRAQTPPARIVIWSLRWMLFRLMLGAGLIKLRGDSCWRDFTCLIYHYETQPNPHPLSYFFHQLPAGFHMFGVGFNHFVELLVPFAYFGPRKWRRSAGILSIVFQITLILSGNLSWLNWLTLLMCIPCLDDEFLSRLKISSRLPALHPLLYNSKRVVLQTVIYSLFLIVVVGLSLAPAANLIQSNQMMNYSYNQWHLINSYGAFGSITKERYEVIIKATDSEQVDKDTVWKEYEFFCAPGDVARSPCLITPYHYHLDWQIWFSGMHDQLDEEWLLRLAARLLENDPVTTKMFRSTPYVDKPPQFIKMDLYRYQFTSLKDWPHAWWQRQWVKEYMPPVSLKMQAIQNVLN